MKAVARRCLKEMVKFSRYIKIILPAHRGHMCPCYCSMIICTCYSSLNLVHSKAHRHTLGAWLLFTHRICPPLEKVYSLLISLQHQVQMFGQLSCSISNDHLDLFWQKKRQPEAPLWRDCLFWAENVCSHFLHTWNTESSPWGLSHNQAWAALRQVSRGLGGHLHLGC